VQIAAASGPMLRVCFTIDAQVLNGY
jgi:hypothetical protein